MTDSTETPGSRPTRLDFGFVTALAVVGAVVAALILTGFVSTASRPLGWAVACAVVAALVRPVIDGLDRHLPHALAVVVSMLGVALVMGLAYAGVVNTVADNVDTIIETAPEAASEIEARNDVARDFELADRVEAFVGELDERVGTSALVERSTSTLSTYMVTGILVLFLIGYGRRFVEGGLDQIDDEGRRARVRRIGELAVRNWRRYVWAALGTATAITVAGWSLFWALDLPAPFVLALILGTFSLVPMSGIVLGGLPALLFAAATTDPPEFVAVLVFIVVAQMLEVFVIRPSVDHRSVQVGPALPLMVGLVGWEIYGLGGALYGVLLLILALATADAIAVDEARPVTGPAEIG